MIPIGRIDATCPLYKTPLRMHHVDARRYAGVLCLFMSARAARRPERRSTCDYDIKALSPELLPDYLGFFDRVAFTDNPDWASCYCVYYHHDPAGKPWDKRTGAENRELAGRLIRSGRLRGFLAYTGDEPAGWCNVNDKRSFALARPG